MSGLLPPATLDGRQRAEPGAKAADAPAPGRQCVRDRTIHRTVLEARQGVTGHKVRYVLLWSCALAVVLLGVIFLFVASSG